MLNVTDKRKDILIALGFFVVALFIFSIKLGDITFATGDEYYYFQTSKNMLESGRFLSPTYEGAIRFQKPILTYWAICSLFWLLGISWYSARLYSVILASLGIALTFLFGRRISDRKTGLMSAIVLMTIEVYFIFARTVTTDMPFVFFLMAAFYSFWLACEEEQKKERYVILFYASVALATLTKGIQGIVLPGLVVGFFTLLTRKWYIIKRLLNLKGILLFIILTVPWFAYSWFLGKQLYVEQVVGKELMGRLVSTGYKIRPVYYLKYLFIRSLPWSLFFIGALFAYFRNWRQWIKQERTKQTFCLIWIVVILAAYTFITSKHKHYVLQVAAPLALFVGSFFSSMASGQDGAKRLSFRLPLYITAIGSTLSALVLVFFIIFIQPPKMCFVLIQPAILLIIPIGLLLLYKKRATVLPILTGITVALSLLWYVNVTHPIVSPPEVDQFVKTIKKYTRDGRPFDIVVGTYGISSQRFALLLGRPVDEIVDFVPWNHAEKLMLFFKKDETVFFPVSEWDLEDMEPWFRKFGLEPEKLCIVDSVYVWRPHMISEDPDTSPPKITSGFIKERAIDILRWDRERFLKETRSNIFLITNYHEKEEK